MMVDTALRRIVCSVLLFCLFLIVIHKRQISLTSTLTLTTASYDSESDSINGEIYKEAKKLVSSKKDEIWKKWDVSNYPLFLTLIHIPSPSWELQKSKLIELILRKDRFVVGFGGSSVTAGHDNYHHEAYPQVFYDTLDPLMKLLSITFVVRNRAIGNNPCYPYDECLNTHLGNDLDVVTWEQSMNCGRESKPLETFTRIAAQMPKKPTVIYITSGTPSWTQDDCRSINSSIDANTKTAAVAISMTEIVLKPYKAVASLSNHMDSMSFLKINKTSSIYKIYDEIPLMGMNILSIQDYKCQGPYGPDFSWKTPEGVSGASWHPGRRGHLLRGEALAYAYLSLMEESLDAIINGKLDSGRPTGIPFYSRGGDVSSNLNASVLQKSVQCESEVCSSVPNCYTDYQPREMNSLASLIVGRPKVFPQLSYYAYNSSATTQMNMDATMQQLSNRAEITSNAMNASWIFQLSMFDKKPVDNGVLMNLGYIDRKYIYVSNAKLSSISFLIHTTRINPVWICEVQKGFVQYPATFADLGNENATAVFLNEDVSVDEVYEDDYQPMKSKPIKLPPLSSAYMQCYRTIPIKAGSHVITVQQADHLVINIAYLLYW